MEEEPKLKRLFWEYMKIQLIGNEQLIQALFCAFCGTVFQIKTYYGGGTLIPTVSTFSIQDSGTGKSQAEEAVFWLVRDIIPANRTFKSAKTSDAALIGSPDINKKRENEQSRLLFKKDFLYWDEGSQLLKNSPFSEDLQDIVQMALDQSRWIEKALKDGIVRGYTNTTIISGSYFEDNIKYQVLRRGFFQRFFVTFKKFSEAEKIEIQQGMEKLERNNLFSEKKRLQREIKKELTSNYGYRQKVAIEDRKVIRFNEDASKEFTKFLLDYYKENILHQYMDNRQEILETFWSRVRLLVVKISVQAAFLNHRMSISIDDLHASFDTVEKYHVQGVKILLDSISDDKIKYRKVSTDTQKKYLVQCIKELTKKHKDVTQSMILDYVTELKSKGDEAGQKPNFGRNRAWRWLKDLEKEGVIKVKSVGEKNRHFIEIE